MNDTLGPKVLQEIQEQAEDTENIQNTEISNIMAALNSIKYDNALLKNKHLLNEVQAEIQREAEHNGSIGYTSNQRDTLIDKLNITNQSLKDLVSIADENLSSAQRVKLVSMLPLERSGGNSEIDKMRNMLEELQINLRNKGNFNDQDMRNRIQKDLAEKETNARWEAEYLRRMEDTRLNRSVFAQSHNNSIVMSQKMTERSGRLSAAVLENQQRFTVPESVTGPVRQQVISLLDSQQPQ